MNGLWLNLTNSDIYKSWPESKYDPAHGILFESGYYDNTPVHDLMLNLLDGMEIEKRLIVSATDVNNGHYVDFHLYDKDSDEKMSNDFKVSAVQASAAVPFMFPPKDMKPLGMDALLMDGGTTWNSNMISGINECFKVPGITSKSQIEVDIIILDPFNIQPEPLKSDKLETKGLGSILP